MKVCYGDGSCFIQINDVYMKTHKIKCDNHCLLIECPNYKVCKQKHPLWLLMSNENMCPDCNMERYKSFRPELK